MDKFEKLMEVTDLVMLDIKEMDPEKHKALTGQTNENILALADWLSDYGKAMWIRHVLVPDLTDDEEGLQALRAKLDQWTNVERVEILPYRLSTGGGTDTDPGGSREGREDSRNTQVTVTTGRLILEQSCQIS